MADPLRRTLLAKLRGKKSKKGATAGCGYGSPATAAAAAANGGREGKEKVLQKQRDFEAGSVVLLTGLDYTAERMSTYENCVEGSVVEIGGFIVRDSRAALAGACPQERASGGRGRVNEELLGVSLQRGRQFGGHAVGESDRSHQGPRSAGKVSLPAGGPVAGAHAQRKHLVPVPRQCRVGDSIGFGDSCNHVLFRTRVEPHSWVVKQTECRVAAGDSNGTKMCLGRDGTDPRLGHRHMAGNVVAVNEHTHNANLGFDSNPALEEKLPACATLVYPNCISSNTEENILIRNIESYGSSPECAGDIRGNGLQSPTFFPTELEICDINMTSLCAREGSLRYHSLDSEDEDYYDNEILPFYETVRAKSDSDSKVEVTELTQPGQDKGQVGDSNSAQETDRLRSQLKEAYYLLINAMHDINLDVQQLSGGLIEQQTTSSCSSHSRDSLCSRLSAKNMDSDSWSSGGDHSAQQVSDTDSLLLCLSGNLESCVRGRLNSKSMLNLSFTKIRPALVRSASDGAIRYLGGPSLCVEASGAQSPEICEGTKEANEAKGAKVPGVCELSGPQAVYDAASSEELLQDTGGEDDRGSRLHESSGSVNSLTGSSDNTDASTVQGHNNKQKQSGTWAQGATGNSVNKSHGVTVNKMQEWMHKGRLLSSEMKQRIEGSSSSLPRGGRGQDRPCPPQADPGACKAGAQTSSRGARGVKCAKSKSLSPIRGGKPGTKSPRQSTSSAQQPAFTENVQGSCANSREVGRTIEPSLWRPPLNTITVSKKRNWLQQSSLGKIHGAKDEPQGTLAPEEESSQVPHQPPPPSSPSPDHLRPPGGAPSRPLRLHLPQVSVGQTRVAPQPRCVDPAEENDADDEGEIWYNPIPEDDEPEMSHRSAVRLLVPPRREPQAPQRRPSRGGDVGQGGRAPEGPCSAVPEAPGESLGGGGSVGGGSGGDGSQGNAVHSTEALHLHRQMLACKPQEEGGPSASRLADGPDLPNAVGFSPPSSPNPTKKASSINWSFPDKIKSPRTVRKISMKMKRLPELSRKLSVKGTPSSSNSNNGNGSSQSEPKTNSSGPEAGSHLSGPPRLSASGGGQVAAASRNVISRYHLDSSVSTQHSFSKKKSNGGSKSASKGGYLSDGDSPELVAKSGKHSSAEGKGGKGKETAPGNGAERTGGGGAGGGGVSGGGSPKLHGTELDIDAFRHYSFTEQPKCSQYISGLMSLHFYGAEDLKPPRIDSRDVYCAIQVDSVNKARTALLTCRTTFLDMDHTFNIELENAQHLKLVVFSWEPTPRRNRVCCHGTVVLPALFRVTRSHQLAVKLEPRGLIYVKLSLMEQWQNSLDGGPDADREPQVFGVEAWRVVERENTGLMVPLLIEKCITEIEKRGCQVVGLYRLCGSAAVKKELREAFERDSHAVELCENTYPDINVITGVLKDYLRELPYPLITKQLYEAVLESMARRPLRMGATGCENDQADSEHTVSLLDNLPEVERVTLRKLLDHLKLVASHQEVNKMTCQNLAVCFGPVLLSQRQEASCHTNRVFIDSEELASALHFKKHIEVLHYLLQLWPVVDPHGQSSANTPVAPVAPSSSDLLAVLPLRRRKERPQVLNLTDAEMAGVLRPKPGRLDSPSNRYAGDWSGCGESYFPPELLLPPSKEEADYDDVPSEDMEPAEEAQEKSEDRGQEKGAERGPDQGQDVPTPAPAPTEQERLSGEAVETQMEEEEVKEGEEEDEEHQEEVESDGSGNGQPSEEEERMCEHILPPRLPKEHTYQAYMKIQDISPVLSNRVNLRDLQESIDTLIGNLERELNKNKLNVGY
ncbi:rho GTPase-activating protein SYDE2 isoform X2 [Myripristis murdjan]|uniref:rho GTPase-activating protein SYDE2 isoform X2 n=1 Tax=Myripristis murdjan TaxID=586833 RepID=UPI001175F876|nr:rho GTPase-activating protein SYDE2 isoform X2 [Myripristis murdjan]